MAMTVIYRNHLMILSSYISLSYFFILITCILKLCSHVNPRDIKVLRSTAREA